MVEQWPPCNERLELKLRINMPHTHCVIIVSPSDDRVNSWQQIFIFNLGCGKYDEIEIICVCVSVRQCVSICFNSICLIYFIFLFNLKLLQ